MSIVLETILMGRSGEEKVTEDTPTVTNHPPGTLNNKSNTYSNSIKWVQLFHLQTWKLRLTELTNFAQNYNWQTGIQVKFVNWNSLEE